MCLFALEGCILLWNMGTWRSSAREEQPYLYSVLLLVSHKHKLLVCVFPQVVNSNNAFFFF